MGIGPLAFAERTRRPTPLIIVSGTSGSIFSGRWRIFVSFVRQRTPLSLLERHPAPKRLRSPFLGEAGMILEVHHPVSVWSG